MFGSPTPVLRSFDERPAREFHVEFPGLDRRFENRFGAGAPLYMAVGKGGLEHFGDAIAGAAVRSPVDNVSAHMAVLRSRNYSHARPGEPEETSWGSREITITDPAGNRLTFYTAAAEGND